MFVFDGSPTAYKYLNSRAPFSCILGPVGSGKSVASLMRASMVGEDQMPSPDGVRRTRGAVVRNTMPELRATTIETYRHCYPEGELGPVIMRSPAEHIIRSPDGTMEVSVLFIALDKASDVKKLLSLELTWAFLNEGREIPRAVLNRMGERVGRYLLEQRPNSWRGIWMDSNPPDADHWLYTLDQVDRPSGWEFHHQPPGVLEVEVNEGGYVTIADENFPELSGRKLNEATVRIYGMGGGYTEHLCPVEVIRSADRSWIVNPWAENMSALARVNLQQNPIGVGSYYGQALAGKTIEEIRSYLQGVYTLVSDGRRVVPNYSQEFHSREHISPIKGLEIFVNCDIGGGTLQPSAIFMQRHPKGPLICLSEVVCTDATGLGRMGVKRFGQQVMRHAVEHYGEHLEAGLIKRGWGDPAGVGKDEIFEVASFDYLRAEFGLNLKPAPSQDPRLRQSAIIEPCGRIHDGVPGLLVSRRGCPMLHKGLMGRWFFKRVKVADEERYQDQPVKNDYSHPCDALSYGALGMGEFRTLSPSAATAVKQVVQGQQPASPFSAWPEM